MTGKHQSPVKYTSERQISNTVTDANYILCHECCFMMDSIDADIEHDHCLCPRCGTKLEFRLKNSMTRTWALLITAMIFFVPANIYPIMVVDSITGKVASTIMEGIVLFIAANEYFVALVIFVASIIVPAIKMVGMSIILLSIHKKSHYFYKHRSLMFRFIQFIGRWSMLDIFVVAIMVTLVNFGVVSTIHAGPAATSFGLVVIMTMYAAVTFDPRLIWDNHK
ncbi:MAG: paraquat-inducible protein A [Pseudomonadota bacterium]